jgi:hypothetical protein
MADDQYRKLGVRPTCGFEHSARAGVGRYRVHGAQFPARNLGERLRRLLRARGRADENASAIGQMPVEPFGRSPSLLLAARRQLAGEVGLAIFRFGVTPEY